MGEWENLPNELLRKIGGQHLTFLKDKIRLACVCKSWQSSIISNIPNRRRYQLPFLLAPSDHPQASHELFDMFEKRSYYLDLPAAKGKLFRGSSYGWVATVEDTPSMYLINPLTGVKINLPPRDSLPDIKEYLITKRRGKRYIMRTGGIRNRIDSWPAAHVRDKFLGKIILTSSPQLKDDYIAVAIYGVFSEGVAYCKHGDKKWTPIPMPINIEINDIIFYQGQLHAIDEEGTLFSIEIGPCPKVIETNKQVHPIRFGDTRKYLIESSIGLLMVSRLAYTFDIGPINVYLQPYKTVKLEVFMFDSSSCRWQSVTSIGGDVLFIGHNTSMSLPSHEFPGAGNKIYFTDNLYYQNKMSGGYDIGVFDLESGTIESLSGFDCNPRFIFPTPVWFIPNA